MSLGIAFRAFFAALFNSQTASRIAAALESTPSLPAEDAPSKTVDKPAPKPPAAPSRSDAISLLSTLQREARLVDLICEPVDQFSDAQVGAAAREVLRDCRKSLDRMFAISPVSDKDEGAAIAVPSPINPATARIVGKSSGKSGIVVHRGWKATCCEIPAWQGDRADALVIAPVEIEVN